MGTIIYNGVNISNTFHVFTDDSETFIIPEKDYEYVSIPNKDGDLLLYNYRLKNVTLPVNCFIRDNFVENYRNLMQFMMGLDMVSYGYKRLEFSSDPGHFRTALFTGAVKAKPGSFNKSGSFTMNFICTPQRWRTSGETEQTFTANGTIHNPTKFFAKPIIRLETSAGRHIIISGTSIDILTSPYPYIDLDCETMTCTYNGHNASEYLHVNSGYYPKLDPGENRIIYSSGDPFPIKITPRWFDI